MIWNRWRLFILNDLVETVNIKWFKKLESYCLNFVFNTHKFILNGLIAQELKNPSLRGSILINSGFRKLYNKKKLLLALSMGEERVNFNDIC